MKKEEERTGKAMEYKRSQGNVTLDEEEEKELRRNKGRKGAVIVIGEKRRKGDGERGRKKGGMHRR